MDFYKNVEDSTFDNCFSSLSKEIVEIPTGDEELNPEFCDPDDAESINESFCQQIEFIHNMCIESKVDGEISIEFDYPPKPNLNGILNNLKRAIKSRKVRDEYLTDELFFLFLHNVLNLIDKNDNEETVLIISNIYANLSMYNYFPELNLILNEFPYYIDRYTTKITSLTSMGMYINALANLVLEEDTRNLIIQNEIPKNLFQFLSSSDIYLFQSTFTFYLHLSQLLLKTEISQEQFELLQPVFLQFAEFLIHDLQQLNEQIKIFNQKSFDLPKKVQTEFLALYNLSNFFLEPILSFGLEELISIYLYQTEINQSYAIFSQNLFIIIQNLYNQTKGELSIFSPSCREQFLKQFMSIYELLGENVPFKCTSISLLETLHPFINDNIDLLKMIVNDSQELDAFKFCKKVSHYTIFTFSQLSHAKRKDFLIPEFVNAFEVAIESRFCIGELFTILKEMKDREPEFTNSFLLSSNICELIHDYLEDDDENNQEIFDLAREIISDLVE